MTFTNPFIGAASSATFEFLVETTLKGTVLLAGAAIVVQLLRGASAAYRHFVWASALVGVVALPALLATLPAWRVSAPALAWLAPAWNQEPAPAVRYEPAPSRDVAPTTTPEPAREGAPAPARSPQFEPHPTRDAKALALAGGTGTSALPWSALALALWAIGGLIVLGAFVAGHLELRRLLRGTHPVRDNEWLTLAIEAAERLGLMRPVALLRGGAVQMPVAFGIVRPRVLLPEGSDDWPVELRRAVLLHEFAHVQRHDCLTQSISQLACALFWFHPAVWWAASQMRSERERACDDRVLAARTRASDYADQLLGMVRSLRAKRLAALGAVAFARPSSLEGRLLAVLDPHRNRRTVGLRVATVTLVAATVLVVPLAVLEPLGPHAALAAREPEREASASTGARIRPHLIAVPEPQKPLEDRAAWAATDARGSDARVWWIGWPIETGSSSKGNNLSDSEGLDLSILDQRGIFTLDDVLSGRTRGTWNTPEAPSPNQRNTAFVLVRMKGGDADRVRVQSAGLPVDFRGAPLYWMGTVSEEQSFRWLRAGANDAKAERLRSQFVQSIGYMRRSDLVTPFLKATLESTAPDEVRAGAAEALKHHPSDENARLLAKLARTDRSPEVRRACVEALGNFQTSQALEELLRIARAGEGDEGLRRVAFDELGEEVSRSEDGDPEPEHDPALKRAERLAKDAERVEREAEELDRRSGPEDEGSLPMPQAELEVQRQAIESLGRYPEAQSLSRLRHIAETSPNDELRAQAVESIGRVGTPAAIEALQQIAWKNRQSQARHRAVEELGRRLPAEQALEQFSAIARTHPSQDTRRAAVEAAGRLEPERAAELLRKIIADGIDVEIQRQAVESLGRRIEPGVRDELGRIARTHRSVDVRRQAVESLGRLGGSGIAHELLEIVEEGGPEDVQRQAVESLGRLDADVMPLLARIAQSHPVSGVRRQAVESMVRRDPDRALPLIEEILRQQKRRGT